MNIGHLSLPLYYTFIVFCRGWCQFLWTVSDYCLTPKWTICQLHCISWREQVTFGEKMIRPTLYKKNMLSWIFIVLAHWNNGLWIDISPYSDSLSWFQATISVKHCWMLHTTTITYPILISYRKKNTGWRQGIRRWVLDIYFQ